MFTKLPTSLAIVVCAAWALGGSLEIANGFEPPRQEQRASSDEIPLGVPDYSKLSGSILAAKPPLENPEVLWKYASVSPVTDLTVASGIVYFATEKGQVVALRASDGSSVWKHEHGSRITMEPSVDNAHVYFASEKGVTALNREFGALAWHYFMPLGAGETTPIPIDDRVFASSYDGNTYALSRDTGAVLWKHSLLADAPADQPGFDGKRARFQNILARPCGIASDGKMVVQCVFDQSRAVALDCTAGKRLWTFQTGGWVRTPTIVEGKVFVPSQDKQLYCLDPSTGKLIWEFETPSWLGSAAALHEGVVYLPHHRGRLYRISAKSGEQLGLFEPEDVADRTGHGSSFALIANETAYFANSNGLLYAVDVNSGKLRWKFRPAGVSRSYTSPVTDGRRVFVTSGKDLDGSGEYAVLAIGGQN